jgi:hypothetical protein
MLRMWPIGPYGPQRSEESANFLCDSCTNALENDWGKVDYLLGKIRKLGMDNEWVKEIERELRSLAERHDGAMFAKEARYAASKMSSRLASRGEMAESLDAAVPDFLRRKMAQGKHGRR